MWVTHLSGEHVIAPLQAVLQQASFSHACRSCSPLGWISEQVWQRKKANECLPEGYGNQHGRDFTWIQILFFFFCSPNLGHGSFPEDWAVGYKEGWLHLLLQFCDWHQIPLANLAWETSKKNLLSQNSWRQQPLPKRFLRARSAVQRSLDRVWQCISLGHQLPGEKKITIM